MKTKKSGNARPIPLWVGKTITCPHCDAEFEVEANDKVSAKMMMGVNNYHIDCPTKHCNSIWFLVVDGNLVVCG